ncbi:MAG: hypothetical protein ACE145_14130 [Terriglobia bacterium]
MFGPENNPLQNDRPLCRQFDLDLPAYLEGEEKPAVLKHARECAFCAVILADLEQIRFASHHLPMQEPPARLWANVRATLAEEGILHEQAAAWRRWFQRLPLLAESVPVGALAGLAILAVTLLNSPQVIQNAGLSGSQASEATVVTAGILPVEIDSSLARTIEEMQAAYHGREDSLEPGVRETYRKSLASLDASIEECRRHCQRAPHDSLARQYLSRAYQSKAEVLASALEFSGR